MRKNGMLVMCLVAGLGVAASAWAAVPGTVATFDGGEDGFIGSTIATTQIHVAAGGNPNGFVQIRKELGLGIDEIGTENDTSPSFLGDYAAAGINGAGFDLNVFNTPLDGAHLRFRRNVGENGWHYDFGAVVPDGNTWKSYDVAFSPTWDDATALGNGWTQEVGSPSFADLMSSVGWIEARVVNLTSSLVGIDNVRIVPEPSALALLGAGLALLIRRR